MFDSFSYNILFLLIFVLYSDTVQGDIILT